MSNHRRNFLKWHVNIGRVFDSKFDLSALQRVTLKEKQIKLDDTSTVIFNVLHHSSDLPKLYFRPRWTNGVKSIKSGTNTGGYLYVLKDTCCNTFDGNELTDYKAIANCELAT